MNFDNGGVNHMGFDIHERKKEGERAVLAGVINPEQASLYSETLFELGNLAETSGIEVLTGITQRRKRPHPGTYFGQGKLNELNEICSDLAASLIVFNDPLTPSQSRNIEEFTGVRVVDRIELILDIFALHAQTRTSKMQVELAQLEYAVPRLRRMWTHLNKQQGGVGFRGPGEKQLEMDKQMIQNRIVEYKRSLSSIQKRKAREVGSRNEKFSTVGLVGYTNAGKSSLMNQLTRADVLVEDKLFATLDTRTRLWEISKGREVLLSDTVGFIDKLPHRLVASFKATLEEANQADILLHVVDASHPDAEHQIKIVEQVLEEVGISSDYPCLYVFNKIDQVKDHLEVKYLQKKYPQHICISAKTGENIPLFKEKVISMLEKGMLEIDAFLPAGNGKLLSWIAKYGRVIEKTYLDCRVKIRVCLDEKNVKWLEQQAGVECIY